MLTVSRDEAYLFIGIQCMDKSALPPIPADPDAAPSGRIYQDISGALVLATEIAGGVVALSKQNAQLGLYGVGLPISATTPLGRYWVRITFDVGGSTQAELVLFEVVDSTNPLSKSLASIG